LPLQSQTADDPPSHFQSYISLLFLVFMCLLEEKEANNESENYNTSAHDIWEKVRESSKYAIGLEESWVIGYGVCERAPETSAYDGSTEKVNMSISYKDIISNLPKTPYKGHDRKGSCYY
jgi:hypothetical protein